MDDAAGEKPQGRIRRWLLAIPRARLMSSAALLSAAALALAWARAQTDVLPSWSTASGWLGRWWAAVLSAVFVIVAVVISRRGRPAGVAGDAPARRSWDQLATAVTAFTALSALVFTALSLGATRDQISVAEQGQITDRYTKAIDQLGSPGPERVQIRLGGIFALERLAADSPRDQQTIVEVLSAFIRTTSPRTSSSTVCPRSQVDVEAAFVVLTRRDTSRDADRIGGVDLRNTCLAEIRAVDADLSRLALGGADLHGAVLIRAHGTLVGLSGVTLTDARLDSADLTDFVFFDDADMTGASLTEAKLSSLSKVKLVNADLTGADLHGADLNGVDLTGARHNEKTNTTGTQYDAATIGAWW